MSIGKLPMVWRGRKSYEVGRVSLCFFQKTIKNQQQNQEVLYLNENTFMRVDEVAKELGVSKSYAYKIVQQLNAELKSLGYLTISGRVNRKFFLEKLCYGEKEKRDA